jgi:WD40 repeat protein
MRPALRGVAMLCVVAIAAAGCSRPSTSDGTGAGAPAKAAKGIDGSIPLASRDDGYVLSPDGKVVATLGKVITLWDTRTLQQIGDPLTNVHNSVEGAAFSPDSKTLASVDEDGVVRLWDVAAHRQKAVLHSSQYGVSRHSPLAFSPDGKLLALGVSDIENGVWLWDVASQKLMDKPLAGTGIDDLAFLPDGQSLLLANSGNVSKLSGTYLYRLGAHQVTKLDEGSSFVVSRDGRLAAISADHEIHLIDLPSRQKTILQAGDAIFAMAFSQDGKMLAVGSRDRQTVLFDTAKHTQIGQPISGQPDPAYALAFSPDGKSLAVGANNVFLFDVASQRHLGTTEQNLGEAHVDDLAFSPNGASLFILVVPYEGPGMVDVRRVAPLLHQS